jgi:hypothetical protein
LALFTAELTTVGKVVAVAVAVEVAVAVAAVAAKGAAVRLPTLCELSVAKFIPLGCFPIAPIL